MKLSQILLSTRIKLKKMMFTISLFALRLVATDRIEKQNIYIKERIPASESKSHNLNKASLNEKFSRRLTCHYIPGGHKFCATQAELK